jgi:hypothetical protein
MTTDPASASPSTPGAAPLDHHGGPRPRGIDRVPRSLHDSGRFGRLFRQLPPLKLTEEQLQAVAQQMLDTGGAGGWNAAPGAGDVPTLPAGYTYLGQFIDHDITFDPVSLLTGATDPDGLENFRTPRFDLDSVYGGGPGVSPWLYQKNDPDKLLIGTTPGVSADLPRNQEGVALVGDPRNDVQMIITQLHLAVLRFHNAVVDLVRANPALVGDVPATPTAGWTPSPVAPGLPGFPQIATLVRWHYQWIVLRDFLPRIVGQPLADDVLRLGKGRGKNATPRLKADLQLYKVRNRAWMPLEFSVAAYRFGHSLVRDAYQLNTALTPLPVFATNGDDLRGHRPIPAGWEIQWSRFFDGLPASAAGHTQVARAFDTKLAPAFSALPPSIDRTSRPLALLNLLRGNALALPSGEDVAAAIAATTGDTLTAMNTGLAHPAPLWFWILKEAEAGGGQHLGPVGGRIVAETLVGLAHHDRASFLRAQPDWTPELGPTTGTFTMADLLTTAGLNT